MCKFKINKTRIVKFQLILILLIICSFYFKYFLIIPYMLLVVFFIKGKMVSISPLLYFLVPWGFMITMYYSNIIIYTKINNNEPLIYIFTAIICVVLGYMFASKVKIFSTQRFNENNNTNINNEKFILRIVTFVSILGLIGSLLYTIELLFITGIDLRNLSATRYLVQNREVTVFSQIGSILGWGSLVALVGLIVLWNNINKRQRIIWLISSVLFSLFSVLSSGRQVVLQIMLVIICSLSIRNSNMQRYSFRKIKSNKKINFIFGVLILSIVIYSFYVATNRNDNLISDSKIVVLAKYFGFKFDENVQSVLYNLPSLIGEGLAEAIVYYTHEIPEFTIFWSIPKIGPFGGLYSIPFIDRRLYTIGLTQFSVDYKMAYVRSFMISMGSMPVGWKTFLSFLILDYGKIGGLFVCFLLGSVSAYIYKCYKKRKGFFSALFLVRINVGMIYTIMFPAVSDTGLLFMLVFCLIMFILESTQRKYYFNINQ